MLPVKGIYEVAIRVGNLKKAEKFYRETMGFTVGIRDENRKWLFLRTGGAGMIVLQEDKSLFLKQHFAFTVCESDFEQCVEILKTKGVKVSEPQFHEWMPAVSVYFSDPDGHDLELCAPIENKGEKNEL